MVAQAGNPFYIRQTAPDFAPLQGIAERVMTERKIEADKVKQQQLMQQAQQLFRAGDSNKIAEFMMVNPTIGKQMRDSLGFVNKQQEQRAIADAKTVMMSNDPRQEMVNRVQRIAEAGGDATQSIQMLAKTPDEIKSRALDVLTLTDPAAAKAWREGRSTQRAYSNVKTTASGRLMGLNKNTGVYEIIPTPEKAEMRKGTRITVNTPQVKGLSEEQKVLGKGRADRYLNIQQQADEAQTNLNSLDRLEAFDINPNLIEPYKEKVGSFIHALGGDPSFFINLSTTQAYAAEAGKMVQNILNAAKGTATDADRAEAIKMGPSISNTAEANAYMINTARAIGMRKLERAEFQENYLENRGTLTGAESQWKKHIRDTRLLSTTQKDPSGGPLYYYKFRQYTQQDNPQATKAEIDASWRDLNK